MSVPLFILLLPLLAGNPDGRCDSQPIRLADSPATVMSHLGTPTRTERVAAMDGQPGQVFYEWDTHRQHTVIALDPDQRNIQTILFTERGSRCTMWDGVPVGKATVQQLLELRGTKWTRRHYGCDHSHLRLVFTYPDGPTTTVEYTAFISKASVGRIASELCADVKTPTDQSIDRLERVARTARIRAVAVRRTVE